MKEENIQQRILAVERFNNGESPEAICASLHKSGVLMKNRRLAVKYFHIKRFAVPGFAERRLSTDSGLRLKMD